MRKTFVQCCLALLLAPVLVCMLTGTIALAASGANLTAARSGSGASGGNTSTTTPDTARRLRIEVIGDAEATLKYGEEKRLAVKVYTKLGENGSERDVTRDTSYFWSSSDSSKVYIPINTVGGVRVVGVGEDPADNQIEVTVAATYGGITETETFTITVVDDRHVRIEERTAAVEQVYLTAGTSKNLMAYVSKNGSKETGTNIAWTSSDLSVVRVEANTDGSVATLIPAADITEEKTVTITASSDDADPAAVTCIISPNPTTDPDDPDDPNKPPAGDTLPEGNVIKGITIENPKPSGTNETYVMNPGSVTMQMKVTIEYSDKRTEQKEVMWNRNGKAIAQFSIQGQTYDIEVALSSDKKEVASTSELKLIASKPGEAVITAKVADGKGGWLSDTAELKVTVSGYELLKDEVTIEENQSIDPVEEGIVKAYGSASTGQLTYWSDDSLIATYINGAIVGTTPGTTQFTVSAGSASFRGTFKVTVISDPNATIEEGPIKNTDILKFSTLLTKIRRQAGGNLSHITGLNVDPSQGTLYYKYVSESVTGSGVGSGNYYHPSRSGGVPSGQRSIADITFVPKSDYLGGQVTISYTAVSEDGKNYSCKILVTVTSESGSAAGITCTTDYNTPIKFSSDEFNRVCRERLGINLSYVVFSQPPERQGMLYTNYSGSGNYGSVVDIRRQYTLKELDDVWFVPAPGYSGSVTVYYTAYGVGANGGSYSGQVNITVNPEGSVEIGGLVYDVFQGGVAHFDDEHFNSYCRDVLYEENRYDRQTLSYIRFDSLPAESQGVLYYDYRSSTSSGSRANTGTSYYYGVRNPRIDRLAFVPAADFTGTLRLPFTGWTADGTRFTGNVEINVRSGSGGASGDIYYNCQPGRTVSFRSSDFTSLSQAQAGRTLDYIVFQSLPDSMEGSLYYGSTRITTVGSRYQNNNISRLSFRASTSFSGLVNIPFEGRAANGVTFQGVVTIGSDSSGSSNWSNIRYTADSKTPAVFARNDFDAFSRWETGRDISAVRFTIPSSGQGTLYRNYRSSSSPGTRITSSNTSITASDLDRVAFVPVSGYTGTVYIDFTATAASSGGSFTGTVEIEVGLPPADVTARYSTRTQPVYFYSGDLARSHYTLSSVQFNGLPAASEGYLYYQYTSPTRYGQLAGTNIAYRPSGSYQISELAFVPRAGFTGTVTIPYTGTNSNGSTFAGEVIITVSPTYSSAYFSDMAGYSNAQRAAVDFLYDHNITQGMTTTQYGPESSIRRGDFARMLYQAFELSPSGTYGAFRDVSSSAYYAEAVNTLYNRGIVSGIGNGLYAPDSTLTRQDAICMVQRAMKAVGWTANDGYASALFGYGDSGSVSGYAQGAMSFAVQRGYLPTSGSWLNPTQPLTRVDMAEIIHRVLTY